VTAVQQHYQVQFTKLGALLVINGCRHADDNASFSVNGGKSVSSRFRCSSTLYDSEGQSVVDEDL